MACRKDSTLPGCLHCRPNDPEKCPLYNGGPIARGRSSNRIGIFPDLAFDGGIDDATESDIELLKGTKAGLPNARRFRPEVVKGTGK